MSNSEYKYQQLKDTILAAIRSGELPPGAKIEPELELMRQHQLSRNTVRQALIELESDGVLYRARRLGTFVRRQPPARIAFLMPDAAYATYPLNSDIIRGMDAVLTPANYALNVMVGALRYEPDTVSRLADDCSGVLISTNEPDPELLAGSNAPFAWSRIIRRALRPRQSALISTKPESPRSAAWSPAASPGSRFSD